VRPASNSDTSPTSEARCVTAHVQRQIGQGADHDHRHGPVFGPEAEHQVQAIERVEPDRRHEQIGTVQDQLLRRFLERADPRHPVARLDESGLGGRHRRRIGVDEQDPKRHTFQRYVRRSNIGLPWRSRG
jgi:hypothetical protein